MDKLIPLLGQSSKVPQCSDTNNNNKTCIERRIPLRTVEYSLRPRSVVRRLQLDRNREGLQQKNSKSSKSRPPPLSKYRRKTANARERHRMKEINDAFESLRRILPDICSREAAAAMTKITTLRLAVSYIRALSRILQDGHPGDITFFEELHFDVALESSELRPTPNQSKLQRPEMFHSTSPLPTSIFSPISCSLSTDSDLSELLSDDSCCVFEDNLDAFDDIPALPEADPFALMLPPEGEALLLGS
ncbi:helix-loop-helix protein ngn-1-like [Cherax quadricarinatus]|uniref:helix-loop-helix protein ngn-1-like n=1 Tax=Cherax quadricarinatus TaxID=27406 RepID=UPI002379ADBC|nr:helix-loop-helix protein ngn-1-like [Cherax quadricarinatus]